MTAEERIRAALRKPPYSDAERSAHTEALDALAELVARAERAERELSDLAAATESEYRDFVKVRARAERYREALERAAAEACVNPDVECVWCASCIARAALDAGTPQDREGTNDDADSRSVTDAADGGQSAPGNPPRPVAPPGALDAGSGGAPE